MEVIGHASDKVLAPQSLIIDVAFIVPLGEVESGMVFMVGSILACFIYGMMEYQLYATNYFILITT